MRTKIDEKGISQYKRRTDYRVHTGRESMNCIVKDLIFPTSSM